MRTLERLVLPATLAVSTFAAASSCRGPLFEPQYCADIEGMSACEDAEGCGWSQMYDECVNTCFEIETQEECDAIDRCEWYPDGGPDAGEDGGTSGMVEASCGEPFT